MKTKEIKRLTLNRETVSNLSTVTLNEVKGGTATGYTCVYCNTKLSCMYKPYACLFELTCPETCER